MDIFKVLLDFFQRLAFGFRQEERRGNKGNPVQPAQKKNIAEYPKLPTVGTNTAAMPVPTA